jgi:hypothetical protein
MISVIYSPSRRQFVVCLANSVISTKKPFDLRSSFFRVRLRTTGSPAILRFSSQSHYN